MNETFKNEIFTKRSFQTLKRFKTGGSQPLTLRPCRHQQKNPVIYLDFFSFLRSWDQWSFSIWILMNWVPKNAHLDREDENGLRVIISFAPNKHLPSVSMRWFSFLHWILFCEWCTILPNHNIRWILKSSDRDRFLAGPSESEADNKLFESLESKLLSQNC